MNQYSALVARLPPVAAPADATASTSQNSTSAVPVSDFATLINPSASSSKQNQTTTDNTLQPKVVPTVAAKLEDLGSDDDSVTKLNKEPLPSTSKEFLITPDQQQPVPSTSANSNSNSNDARHTESSEMSEIRRRRLEKFGSRMSSD